MIHIFNKGVLNNLCSTFGIQLRLVETDFSSGLINSTNLVVNEAMLVLAEYDGFYDLIAIPLNSLEFWISIVEIPLAFFNHDS